MRLNITKDRIELQLDDHDMRLLLDGKEVSLIEAGANDPRPIAVTRWKNSEIKYLNRERDLRGIEILTGQKLDRSKNTVPLPSRVGGDAKPFGEVSNAEELEQTRPIPKTRGEVGEDVSRPTPARERGDTDFQSRREGQDLPDRGETHR